MTEDESVDREIITTVEDLADLREGEWIRVNGDSCRVDSTHIEKPEYSGVPVVLIRTDDRPRSASYQYIYDTGGDPRFIDEHATPVTVEHVAVPVVRDSNDDDNAGIQSVTVLGEGDFVRVDSVLHRVDEIWRDHQLELPSDPIVCTVPVIRSHPPWTGYGVRGLYDSFIADDNSIMEGERGNRVTVTHVTSAEEGDQDG